MNIVAFLTAALGAAIIFIGFYTARKIENKIASSIAKIAAFFAGLFTCALLPMALNLPVTASSKSGEYLFYILLVGVIVSTIFKKRKASKEAA
ncbi:hypothetical protein [Simiduia aestuariiviva]|uniref:Uncharacterized protein n=1 Tax=Simiduia aestuariiviva TaxID=1510459 RepID=A0A839UKG3_9GAMM|nr:hypothetical protein [Simiduia aestuariiviva]MBB3167079.1 hypothetical protein [Simiduia aestuariiviva]